MQVHESCLINQGSIERGCVLIQRHASMHGNTHRWLVRPSVRPDKVMTMMWGFIGRNFEKYTRMRAHHVNSHHQFLHGDVKKIVKIILEMAAIFF